MLPTVNIPVNGEYIIVGSAALNLRHAKDIDVICKLADITISTTGDEYIRTASYNGRKFEFLIIDNQQSLRLIFEAFQAGILSLYEVLCVLKAGHIHIASRQENWEKHIHDYHLLKKIVGPFKFVKLAEYIVAHQRTTSERVKQKSPRLKGVTVDKFFDDFVKKYYHHDDIHKAVAHKEKQMYSYMQKDETVECHRDLWEQFTHTEKCWTVLEEAYVIALERQVIPTKMGGKIGKPPFLAFKWALWRICTTLTSGWFRQFAIENYFTILNMYDEEKINKALVKLEELDGRVHEETV